MKTRSKKGKKLPIRQDAVSQTDYQQKSEHLYASISQQQIEQSNSQLPYTLSSAYNPRQIKCRDEQRIAITQFIKDCLSSQGQEKARVLYISGVPGVGKTSATMSVVSNIKKSIHHKKAAFKYINAMQLKRPQSIFKAMNTELYKLQNESLGCKNTPLNLQLKMEADSRMKFIVVDEIDYLLNKDQSVLYNLFEWCNQIQTKLCLIIIANTMDFPEKLMEKLSSRMGQNRLVFKPYSQKQIQEILQERMGKSNRFSSDAILYACKKMSSFTSDIRKILNVLKACLDQSVEIVGVEQIAKNWRRISQEQGQSWQEDLPDFYRRIFNIVKQIGGRANDLQIIDRLRPHCQYKRVQIIDACKVLSQMKLVRMCEKKHNCQIVYEITLLKI